ncbi:MAG: glycosyltransferase family 2 protein [Planctomycetota bacterium]
MVELPQISVVVPVFDEEENLPPLHDQIARALTAFGRPFEIVFVDDRSADRSLAVMLELQRADPRIRVIALGGRSGQTAAMAAGFDHSRGEIVVTIDGDLQNDPADIPALVTELDQGFDVVAGWRKSRQDGFVLRRLPSLVANRLIALVSGVAIHDTGCTLKAFRREVVDRLPIYAEQHRFLPLLSAGIGARVTERVVNHRPRRFGKSKYGLGRAFRVLLDLFVVKMVSSFSQRPLSYFALLVLPFLGLFGLALVTAVLHADRLTQDKRWGNVALFTTLVLFMICVYFLMLGLLSELAVKASGMHRSRSHRPLAR